MKKGETVFYIAGGYGSGALVKAKVLTAHPNGTAKVEAMFFHHEGRDSGPYLGYVFDGVPVYRNAMEAETKGRAA